MRFAKLLRKKSNSRGKAHSASVFFRHHSSATSAASASLRPFGVSCITLARDGQKCEEGTQRRKGRGGRRACVVGSVITLPLVVSLVIALSFRSNKETAKR